MAVEPYVIRSPQDMLKSADWNQLQILARQALQEHDHTGTGDNAQPIGTDGIADGAITDAKITELSSSKLVGAIKTTTAADDAPAGTIRWTGTDFEGKTASGWVSLTTPPVTRQTGTIYYDVANNRMYIVYGEDDNWEAIRYTAGTGEQTSGVQSGTKPTTLSALQALSYG